MEVIKEKGIKVLLLTPLWTGLRGFFLNGKKEFYGMPAFYNSLIGLLNDKDIKKIICILFVKTNEGRKVINIPEIYKSKLIVYPIFFKNRVDITFKIFKVIWMAISLIRRENISIIYGHGHEHTGAISGIISLLSGIPNVRRIYGTFLVNELNRSKFSLFLRHPWRYLTFSLPAKAIIVTNDGTFGDKVYNKIGNKKADFFLWLNGVEVTSGKTDTTGMNLPPRYFSYIARIDRWKRQHLFIKVLYEMKNLGISYPAYIVGPVVNRSYFEEVIDLIKKLNLENMVILTGKLPRKNSLQILASSTITFSLYETSNLGNVFLEALSLGVPVAAIDLNGHLDYFPADIFIRLKTENPKEIALKIKKFLDNKQLLKTISSKARDFALHNLETWDERVKKEIKLIKEYSVSYDD